MTEKASAVVVVGRAVVVLRGLNDAKKKHSKLGRNVRCGKLMCISTTLRRLMDVLTKYFFFKIIEALGVRLIRGNYLLDKEEWI